MINYNKNNISLVPVRGFAMFFVTVMLIVSPAIINTAAAATWYVSNDGVDTNSGTSWGDAFKTIKRGIDESINGDTVLVADGTYTGTDNKNIEFLFKNITVRSVNGPESCIIDLQNDGRGFLMLWGEASVIDGFTIMNGFSAEYGVGVKCIWCTGVIRNCIIKNNSGPQWGAGIDIRPSSAHPEIINTIFSGNHTTTGGSAVSIYQGTATIINCTFVGNTGGTSVIAGTPNTTITNSIVWNNRDRSNNLATIGGIVTYSDVEGGNEIDGNIVSDPLFINTPILWERTTEAGTETSVKVSHGTNYAIDDVIEIDDDGVLRTVTAVVDNTSNFTVEFIPPLVDASEAGVLIQNWGTGATNLEEDFQLYPSSLCIDAGYNLELMAGDPNRDINANPRFIDGDGDENMTVDLGAYEYGDICECDSETPMDLDTDGLDLAYYIRNPGSYGVSTLAEDFGRVNCPKYQYSPPTE